MPSLIPGFEYDVFISYRQNDNLSSSGERANGWVSQFVDSLKRELAATIKNQVNVYFDENPHDGLLETHQVNQSLEAKLRCVIFIPILSHTYCDPKSFAWNHEFLPFCRMASSDPLGLNVKLLNGNVARRVLPVQIHELDSRDQQFFEKAYLGPLRSIEFIFRSPGVNRPLTPHDSRTDNLDRTFYRDQINKTANAIEAIFNALTEGAVTATPEVAPPASSIRTLSWFWNELSRRNVFRAGFTYLVLALTISQGLQLLSTRVRIDSGDVQLISNMLLLFTTVAMFLAWLYEKSPAGYVRTTSAEARNNPYPPSKKKPFTGRYFVLISLAVLVILSYAVYKLRGTLPASDSPITIAVLPFENRSGNSRDTYIAEGIADDIINRLAIISKLRVTNRSSTQKYTAQSAAFDQIARELNVSIIVKGSILREGDQILVTVQLIDGNSSRYLWGDTFQRNADNIISFQTDIARKIADRLKIKLNELEIIRLDKVATDNPTAYDYYLRGRSYYYKYNLSSNDSAIQQFKLAVQLDPRYARAYAGLGDAFAQMHGRFGMEYAWTDSSLHAGQKAIALDSNLSEAYKALATAYDYRKQYDKAYPLLKKSVELNPTNLQAVGNLGTNCLVRGDLVNALEWEKKSAGMDPSNWIPYQLTGWTYRLLGDLTSADSWFNKSMELSHGTVYDTYEHLGYIYVAQGRKNKALDLIPVLLEKNEKSTRVLETAGLIANFAGDTKNAEEYFQRSIRLNPGYKDDRNTFSPIGLGQILLKQGNRVDAEVYLTHAMNNLMAEIEVGSQSTDLPFYISAIYAIRGSQAESMRWLQKAIDANWMDYVQLEFGPYFAEYRNNPAVVEKIEFLRKKVSTLRKKAG